MDLETTLRRYVYDTALATGAPPVIAALADASGHDAEGVRAALKRLASARILVLQPVSGEILMTPPFSAVPTPFLVTTARHQSYANCAWDALGVPIMMRTSARVATACACCGEAITLDVDVDAPPPRPEIVHFAVPAAKWWHDVVFT